MQVQWKGKAILSSSEKTCAIAESGAGIFLPPKDKQICKICARAVPWPLAALAAGGGTIFHSPPFSSRCSFLDNNGRIQMLICRDYFMGGRAAKRCKDFVCEWGRCNPTPAAALVRRALVFLTCWQITKVQEKIKCCQGAAASLGTTPEQAPSSPGERAPLAAPGLLPSASEPSSGCPREENQTQTDGAETFFSAFPFPITQALRTGISNSHML